jgi:hypothetical protein
MAVAQAEGVDWETLSAVVGLSMRLGHARGVLDPEVIKARKDMAALAPGRDKRAAAGRATGVAAQARAAEWKARALPIALTLDARRSPLSRSDMATEILHRIALPVSHRAVETWLQKEVEPSGLIKSRSRGNANS